MLDKSLRQYVISRRLGAGGMGEVWLARDTRLDRDVAIKILPPSAFDADLRRERFVREAKAASALNHPNIVTIYEINSDQGVDFIAMEYVQGRTLSAMLDSRQLPIAIVQQYALQIASAVGRAHRANIVHRDLKPGNIMVTDDGLVKVLDFGLAKFFRSAGGPSTDTMAEGPPSLTSEGVTVGTIGYMSPEQAVGDAVDARSDVFSFGIIVYEMLAGKLPFPASTRSAMLKELHFREPPPLERLRPETPPVLREVVRRCLQKTPGDRYENLTDVASVLSGGAASDSPTREFPSETVPLRPGPAGTRWRGLPAVLAAAIAIALAAFGVWTWLPPRAGPGTAPAGPAAVSNSSEATREAATLLARPDREGNVDRAITLLEGVVSADPGSAMASAQLSTAYLRRQQTNPDAQWMDLAREHAERAVNLNGDLAAAHVALGLARAAEGKHDDADAAFRRAAGLDPAGPWPYIGLGINAAAQNRDADAEAAFGKAVTLGPQEWRAFGEFAQFRFRRSRYADAAALWETALTVAPDNVLVLRNLAAAYFLLDRPDEAASALQRALETRPTAAIYTNLGTIRFFQGRYTDAVPAFEKAVALGANNPQFWGNLGDGYRWAPGRRNDAPAAYRRAIELVREQLAKNPDDLEAKSRLAVYLAKVGDPAGAMTTAGAVAAGGRLTAQMHYRLTVVYELGGDHDRALAAVEAAIRAGYRVKDLASDPELTMLRADARYHRLLGSLDR